MHGYIARCAGQSVSESALFKYFILSTLKPHSRFLSWVYLSSVHILQHPLSFQSMQGLPPAIPGGIFSSAGQTNLARGVCVCVCVCCMCVCLGGGKTVWMRPVYFEFTCMLSDWWEYHPAANSNVRDRAGHFRYFLIFSIIKNDFIAFFIKLITYFCTSSI